MSAGTKLVLVLTILILALVAAYHGASDVPGMSGVRDAGASLVKSFQRSAATSSEGDVSTLATPGSGAETPAMGYRTPLPDVTPGTWDASDAMKAMQNLDMQSSPPTTTVVAPPVSPPLSSDGGSEIEEIPGTPRHTVGPGQTLWEIAKIRLGEEMRWEELALFNGLDENEQLQIGQVILIPTNRRAVTGARIHATPRTHRVRSGETLSWIADTYLGSPTRWRELYEYNQTTLSGGPDTLAVGMQLAIPGR